MLSKKRKMEIYIAGWLIPCEDREHSIVKVVNERVVRIFTDAVDVL